jgi:hypothetical protein
MCLSCRSALIRFPHPWSALSRSDIFEDVHGALARLTRLARGPRAAPGAAAANQPDDVSRWIVAAAARLPVLVINLDARLDRSGPNTRRTYVAVCIVDC